jgi:acyl-CoA synthetase (AMP-forming)/AMP-acid ligase II/pyrroloquinoline quinone (PQQ) biosynthesis protein C
VTALLDAILAHAVHRPHHTALCGEAGSISWSQAATIIERSAAELAERYNGGRPIGVVVDHSPASALLLVALLESGVPAIPLPPFFTPRQTEGALLQAGASELIAEVHIHGDRLVVDASSLSTNPAVLPQGTAFISYSSGSTGEPKGICLAADHLVAVARAVSSFLDPMHAGRHLAVLPFGILLEQVAGLYASMIAGGTYVALPAAQLGLAHSLRPEQSLLLDTIEREHITSLILVPEYLATLTGAMASSGRRLPRLTLVAVGGAKVPLGLLERARAVGLPVRQGYGLTETGSVVTLEDAAGCMDGSTGRSIGLHRLSLGDDGEVIVDGPLYLGMVGGAQSTGPLRTGDRGQMDKTGRLWIEGRKSSLIVTSLGRNIAPEWIEELLVEQPEVAQAMVRSDGAAGLEALIVPTKLTSDVHVAARRANAALPSYARVTHVRAVAPFTPANGQLTGNGRLRRAAIDQAYPVESFVMSFFDRLVAETRVEQARFALTPQLVAGLGGKISREDYLAYLQEAYHHVRHTVPLMRKARERLAARGKDMLVRALDTYELEEIGHEQWILDDIRTAGGDAASVKASQPGPATRKMIDHAYRTISEGNPAALFGMVFVLEGTSVAIANAAADALQRSLDLPDAAVRYLTSHGALDQDHMKGLEALLNGIEDRDDQAAIIAMAREMFDLFGALFASIELQGTRDAA